VRRLLPRRLAYGEEATLVEHLGELRARIVVSLLAVGIGFAVTYSFRGHILGWLNAPLPARLHKPVTFGVAEPFLTSVWVSFWTGLLLALPIVIWQLWAFLAPAFREHYQRTMTVLVVAATALMVGGVLFGYFVALPAAVKFLTNYDKAHYTILIRARDYYSFCTQVLFAVGIVFEVPMVVLGLVHLRVLSAARLRRTWRVGLATMAVIAVALPGVDPVTTTFEMIPLMALYLAAIWLATVYERRRNARAAARDAAFEAKPS
jgi:sec-independent protein translocase protein TatC